MSRQATLLFFGVALAAAIVERAFAAQAPPANPVFDVASIRPSRPDERLEIFVRGRQFVTTASTLYDLITLAYAIHARQVVGGPSWMETEKYDVTAEPDSEIRPAGQQLRLMVQKLLADRFRLAFHRDKKDMSAFTIILANTGIKIAASPNQTANAGVGFQGAGSMIVKSATIADFANFMQRYVLDRPVVDETHLTTKYDFNLKWAANETQFQGRALASEPAQGTADASDLFTAIQEQLGLKMESSKGPVDVLVIDSVQKPTEN